MKTKTLLIAAAALAVGVISSQAQVYSQNVVGYMNTTIPANGFQIIGSQLIGGSDVNATNGDINATLLTGLVSSPNDPPSSSSNSVVYVWNGSGYAKYFYFNQADATTWQGSPYPAGWYTDAGISANVYLSQGKSAFIQNHSGSPMTVTVVGTVFQGTNVSTINPGYNLVNLQAPVSTNLVVAGYGLPGNLTSSPLDPPDQAHNDTLYAWSGSGYAKFYFFNQADATTWEGTPSPAGFYADNGAPMPSSLYPTASQGFFLYHIGSPVSWTNSFSVQ